MDSLQKALIEYVKNTKNDLVNFNLGIEYHKIGNSAAAISYLLRAAELTNNNNLAYECLLVNAINFRKQGKRSGSYRNQILHAISLCPERPEAFFFLSRYYEEHKQYHEAYSFAKIGLSLSTCNKVNELLEYYGKYVLEFEMAVSAWWIGQRNETRAILRKLLTQTKMNDVYVDACRTNLKNIGEYTKFEIKTDWNYAQCMQDIFAAKINGWKTNGTYLEIGSSDPIYNSNTYLLEKNYFWSGMSFDIDQEKVDDFNEKRKNKATCLNAKFINYNNVIDQLGNVIDYLQIDCDPAIVSFEVLKKVPFDKIKFRCITFEHDFFNEKNSNVKDDSRKLLMQNGYIMVADNIGTDINSPFEDWWVHSSELQKETTNIKILVDGKNKTPNQYLNIY